MQGHIRKAEILIIRKIGESKGEGKKEKE